MDRPRFTGTHSTDEASPDRYRMLVVDDNPSIHDDFRRIFTPERDKAPQLDELAASVFGVHETTPSPAFTLDHVLQGQDALERVIAAQGAGRPYALVFLDVRMPPGWDGIETCARVLEVDPDIHIVLCTAYPERGWRRRVEGLQGRDRVLVLKKPFDIVEVQQLADALCERWAFTRRDRARMRDLERSVTEQRGRLAAAATHLRNEIASRTLAERRLDQARRLEGLGRLAAGMCHEINNPLSFIVTSAELIEQELSELGPCIPARSHDDLSELVHSVSVGASRIMRIVRNIKMFARNSETATERVALDEAIESAVGMLQARLFPHVQLRVDVSHAAPVEGRRLELEQVLINLMENAIHALGDQRQPPAHVTITTRRTGNAVCIDVTDNGPGIDPGILDQIFDPFFTTKAIGAGTGLGLSICHSLVRGMSGTLDVRNNATHGATFTISLPLAHSAPAEATPASTLGSTIERRGRLLVIDDEPMVLSMIERLLRPHAVTTANNVHDALALCGTQTFDVILCDVMMPDLDGTDFHRMLGQLRPGEESRVVFITGGALYPPVREFLERIPNRAIDKPFDSGELRKAVSEQLERFHGDGGTTTSDSA